jgi:predicted short-subunit dehydrogenase-like oxidoreductase (DUF2520 family)
MPVAYEDLPRMAERLLVAVADDALPAVARLTAPAAGAHSTVLHTSGRYGAEVLSVLADRGASCGSLHPLQTVATAEQGVTALAGCAFAVDGDGEARTWAEEIAGMLGGTVLEIPAGRRATYHAAAVMASNYVIGLMDAAATLMEDAGVERATALRCLGPLARTSLENAIALGPVDALTGPIERGDARTVASHLKLLAAAPPTVAALYRAAGKHVTNLARRRHPDRAYETIERLLENQDG